MVRFATPARILLGLNFFIFGLNGFLNFIPMQPMPEAAGAYMGALAGTGYFFPVLKITETVSGLLLLANRAVPVALILLAPIIVQIFLFHLFLAPSGLPLALLIGALEAFLGWTMFKKYYRPLFTSRV